MRKLFVILPSLFLAVSILSVSVIRVTAQTSPKYKVTSLTSSKTTTVTPTEIPNPIPTPTKVDYYLPYPGILPDHPLYFVKAVRDRIRLVLITDPMKKADLMLLYADKRLGAGRALVEGGKTELGISTITKSEKYLEEAIKEASLAKKNGKDTTVLYDKLATASLKHQEVLNEILPKLTDQSKEVVQKVMEYSRRGYEEVVRVR